MFHNDFNEFLDEIFGMNRFFDSKTNWEKRTYKSNDGSISFTYMTNKGNDLNENDEIYLLKQKLDECVESQNFEDAVKYRDKIKKLEKNKEKVSKLNEELKSCIENQDFEKAIELRDKIKSLK